METTPPPATPTATETPENSRSRSRSAPVNPGNSLDSNIPISHYSPVAHPNTDPSLLAISQQATDIPIPVEPSLLENGPIPHTITVAFAIDPALGGGPVDTTSTIVNSKSTGAAPNIDISSYTDGHSVEEEGLDTEGGLVGDETAAALFGRNSKRVSAIAEDSDAELRRLAEDNKDVALDELARRVRNDENSPAAERTRQVYGLGWLIKNCERVPDSSVAVPRNRVYARYVGICANERIKPLNPASFGKLVRLMFPEIKTRRLGVRGQSKYHYCGIRLAGENSSPKISHGSSGSEPPAQAAGDDHLMSNGLILPFGAYGSTSPPTSEFQSPLSSFMLNELCFLRNNDPNHLRSPHDAFKIPDIEPYVPAGTDPDVAATLTAIYRSHCTSLVECVRYMRLKQFHQLFVSFHGTLTVPVQKLLGEHSIAPWIRESDWVMYKEMIRLLSPLALQVVPSFVLSALRQLSTNLTSHISTTFSVQPQHVIDSKLAPATIFASLLDRLLRVNDSAHAAARFLGNPPDREQMIKDWHNFVNAQMIVNRELPCYSPLVKDILQSEVANLLQSGYSNGNIPSPVRDLEESASTESVLDQWTNFLTGLPQRFRVRSPRQFNICLGAVSSAALRDLTTNGAISFGSWWVVRCWIDEWMSWQAERGGFLCHDVVKSNRFDGDQRSIDSDFVETRDELANDSNISIQVPNTNTSMLEEVAGDRVNRMPSMTFIK